MKKNPRDPWCTTVTIREESPPLPRPFIFPKSKFPSPWQLFWERHRAEEPDPERRQKMDEAMEKYV